MKSNKRLIKEIVKRLKCSKCNKIVPALNNMSDDRFYCTNCGMNLGRYESKEVEK